MTTTHFIAYEAAVCTNCAELVTTDNTAGKERWTLLDEEPTRLIPAPCDLCRDVSVGTRHAAEVSPR